MNLKTNLSRILCVFLLCISLGGAKAQFNDSVLINFNIDSNLITAPIFDIGLNGFLDPHLKESSASTHTTKRSDYFDQLEWIRRNTSLSILSDSAIHAVKRSHFDQNGDIPLSLSILDFQYIDWEDADSNIFNGNQELTINSTNSSKIKSATACQMGAMYTTVYGTSQSFIIPSDLIFNNTEIGISIAYEANGDGVYHDITVGQDFTIDFHDVVNAPVDKIINFKVFLGTLVLTRPIIVRVFPNSPGPDKTLLASQLIANSCIIPFEFTPGEAQIKIVYSNPNFKSIRKPLIFVEGYDPDEDPLDSRFGLVNWHTYQTGLTFDEKGVSVFQQLEKLPDLVNDVLTQGYDIIIVDFKDPGARIEKNAMALIQVIRYVNSVKTTNEENVIMGASMGGLVARYALRYMEMHNCTHCTKAYLTFDSPHLGANIPHGVLDVTRAMYQHFGKAERQYVYKLNTAAARQMLIYHCDETAYAERQAWQTKLNSMGHPQNCKKILMSSGNQNGLQYSVSPGDLILDWKISQERTFSVRTLFEVKVWSYDPNQAYYKIKAPVATYITAGNIKIPTGVKILDYQVNRAFNNPYTMQNIDYCTGGSSESTGEVIDELMSNQAGIWQQLSRINNKHHVLPNGQRIQSFVSIGSALSINGTNQIHLENYKKSHESFNSEFNPFAEPYGNLVHIKIQQTNINAILEGLAATVVYADLDLPNANNEKNYNFSAQKLALIPSFTVAAAGKLQFNTDRKSAYGRVFDPKTNPSDGTWETSQCGPTRVEIQNQGAMLVGEDPNVANYKATVKFLENSTLELHAESVLRIRDNSTLIIEEGATLIYHPGAKIYLEGENAVLEIRGTLQLENDAVFSFEKGNGAKGGFIRFNLSDNDPNHIRAMGPNCRISLLGETFFSDKVLEIAGDSKLALPYSLNTNALELAEFRVMDGVINFDGNGSIDAGCGVYLKNTDFYQNAGRQGIGLITHGQTNFTLEDCRFENFMLGLKALNNDLGNNFSITNNRFFNCNDGLHTIGREIHIDQGSISTCGFGLILEGTLDAVISGTELLYNEYGLETRGSNTHVRIEDAWFLKNIVFGIFDFEETRFTIECTPFEENGTGIYTNGKVNMSPLFLFPGQTLGGGNNTFFNNQVGLEFQTGEVHLKNGENNFIVPSSFPGPPNFLVGSLTGSASYIPSNLLDASGNYFSNLPIAGIGAGSGSLYMLTSYGGLSPNGAPVLLNGAVLPAMNTVCFNFPRIYPDNKKAFEFSPEEYDFAKDNSLQQLKAYPNPSKDIITLEGYSTVSGIRDIVLYDMQGKEIYQSKWAVIAGTNRLQLPLKDLVEPGVYMLKVMGADGSSQIIRISLSY